MLLLPSALCLPMQIKTFGWVPEVMGWHARIMKPVCCRFFSHLPEFSDIPGVPTVNYIIQRKNGEVWFATYDGGILIYEEGEKVKVLN